MLLGPLSGFDATTFFEAWLERWIADASILSGEPIRIEGPGSTAEGPLPRFEWFEGKSSVRWRMPAAPAGFPYRIDRNVADPDEWDAPHQRTAAWSTFNYQLSARLKRGDASVGAAGGQTFTFRRDGTLDAGPLACEERTRFLTDVLRISEEVARRVPPDRPIPPRL